MTLDEAIKILAEYAYEDKAQPVQDFDNALKLGIETLKRELLFRERVPKKEWSMLSGETEE